MAGELRGAEPLLQGLAGVLALIPAGFRVGEPGLDPFVDRHYQGVIIMSADPFEALILTVLSQNRTGEIVRKVYPQLEARSGGMTPGLLASLDERDLAEVIRSAGP